MLNKSLIRAASPFLVGGAIAIAMSATVAAPLRVRVNRWLEVRQAVGNVVYQKGNSRRPARVGTKLQSVGEHLRTGARSRAVLAVDTGIGFVNVSANTNLRVQQLQTARDGGRITRLQVLSGQAQLRVRKFTNRSSRLEIQTPAGISGVRGTQFGVSVDPTGKTGVATLEGSVVAQAQGRSVPVNAGFQSLIVKGEPPSPPVPLRDDTRLDIQRLVSESDGVGRMAGRVDPVNLLVINDRPQAVDRAGRFDLRVPLTAQRRIVATVVTPLGKQQVYELVIP